MSDFDDFITTIEDGGARALAFVGGLLKGFAEDEFGVLIDAGEATIAEIEANPLGAVAEPAALLTSFLNRVEGAQPALVVKVTEDVATAVLSIAKVNRSAAT